MLMILSLSVVYAAPPGLWPLSDYGLSDYALPRDYAPCRTMASPGTMPPLGLWPLPDYGPFRTMASPGLYPLPDYGPFRDKAKSPPCK